MYHLWIEVAVMLLFLAVLLLSLMLDSVTRDVAAVQKRILSTGMRLWRGMPVDSAAV